MNNHQRNQMTAAAVAAMQLANQQQAPRVSKVRTIEKTGEREIPRNAPCPCEGKKDPNGVRRKFKHCCGRFVS